MIKRSRGFGQWSAITSVALAVITAGISGYFSHAHEARRGLQYQLTFSERTQIQRDLRRSEMQGDNPEANPIPAEDLKGGILPILPAWTDYLSAVNDASFKIYESWNHSVYGNDGRIDYQGFAEQLRGRMDPEHKTHTNNLADLLEIIPRAGIAARTGIADEINVGASMSRASPLFSSSWNYHHSDNTHPETRHRSIPVSHITINADGESEMTITYEDEEYTEDVYDSTDNRFVYFTGPAEQAASELRRSLEAVPTLQFDFDRELLFASRTNAPNDEAIRQSRRNPNRKDDTELTEEQVRNYRDSWNIGSTIRQRLPTAISGYMGMPMLSQQWDTAMITMSEEAAHAGLFRSYQGFHVSCPLLGGGTVQFSRVSYGGIGSTIRGPDEYELSRRAETSIHSIASSVKDIEQGLHTGIASATELKRAIPSFIALVDNDEASERALRHASEQILDTTKRMYQSNISGGIDVAGYRKKFPWTFGFGGLLLGGLVGYGIGSLIDKKREY